MIELPRKYKLRPTDSLEEQYVDLYHGFQYADTREEAETGWEDLERFTRRHFRKLGWGYINARLDKREG